MRGKAWLSAACALSLVACGRGAKQDDGGASIAKRAGNKVGETLTEFTSGVGAGVDAKLVIPVELSSELQANGLSKTVAKSLGVGDREKGFTAYIVATKPFAGDLVAKAYDAQGQEIGRAKTKVTFGADDAKYVTFTFDSQMDANLVARYTIGAGAK